MLNAPRPEGTDTSAPILFVGDIHDRGSVVCPVVERHLSDTGARTVVLLGDLLNDWTAGARTEVREFRTLHDHALAWRRDGIRTVVLLGNHDAIYTLPPRSEEAYRLRPVSPGYRQGAHGAVRPLLLELAPRVAYGLTLPDGRGLLCSHAGVTTAWLEWTRRMFGLPPCDGAEGIAAQTDRLFRERPLPFVEHVGRARGGGCGTVSPLWLDRSEAAMMPSPSGIVQVVGHTPVSSVTAEGPFIFCDTMSRASDGTRLGDGSMLLFDAGRNRWRVLPWPGDMGR